MQVLPATPADAADLQLIYSHYVSHSTCTFETVPPTTAEMADRIDSARQDGLPFLIARHKDGGIAGYAYASPYRSRRPAYSETVEDSVYVSSSSKGQGVGTFLLTALLDECNRAGKRQVIAIIGGNEQDASIRLHERLGFQRRGVLEAVGHKFGESRTCVSQETP